jgi:uncharacterized damage-inducible protein DinB
MIELTRALGHLGWADDAFFAGLVTLPDQALTCTLAPGEWTVGELATHIVGGAEWYRYCLTGQSWTDLRPARGSGDVQALREHLAILDATLLAQVTEVDDRVRFTDENGPRTALRSTILTQACLHAAEHRAQIASALLVNGFSAPVLDDLDLWAYELAEGGPDPS